VVVVVAVVFVVVLDPQSGEDAGLDGRPVGIDGGVEHPAISSPPRSRPSS